ncbi:MAG TPA: hypothetical protein VGL53_16640 [Bryobacteraceae bacterium]|jgi:hypothetical protein
MIVELKPETERLVEEELRSGHVHSVDELIVEGIKSLRDKTKDHSPTPSRKPRMNLADFLRESPFAGSEIDLERQQDYERPIDLRDPNP